MGSNATTLKLKNKPEERSVKEQQSIEVDRKYNLIKWQRKIAFLIDCFPWVFIMYLLAAIFSINLENVSDLIFFLIWIGSYLIYFAVLPYFYSYTLGGYIFKNKIVDSKTLLKPSVGRLILRALFFLTIATGIGLIIYFIIGFYWDRISRITLIKTEK